MTTRLSRFVCQGSGLALAAIVATSMSVHNHLAIAGAQSGDQVSVPAASAPGMSALDRHAQSLHATKIDYAVSNANILHHYP